MTCCFIDEDEIVIEMLNVLYILEALRHEYHARTSTWLNQKGYGTTFNFFCSTCRNAKRVLYPRSAQA